MQYDPIEKLKEELLDILDNPDGILILPEPYKETDVYDMGD